MQFWLVLCWDMAEENLNFPATLIFCSLCKRKEKCILWTQYRDQRDCFSPVSLYEISPLYAYMYRILPRLASTPCSKSFPRPRSCPPGPACLICRKELRRARKIEHLALLTSTEIEGLASFISWNWIQRVTSDITHSMCRPKERLEENCSGVTRLFSLFHKICTLCLSFFPHATPSLHLGQTESRDQNSNCHLSILLLSVVVVFLIFKLGMWAMDLVCSLHG